MVHIGIAEFMIFVTIFSLAFAGGAFLTHKQDKGACQMNQSEIYKKLDLTIDEFRKELRLLHEEFNGLKLTLSELRSEIAIMKIEIHSVKEQQQIVLMIKNAMERMGEMNEKINN